jgi:hypothetical protein
MTNNENTTTWSDQESDVQQEKNITSSGDNPKFMSIVIKSSVGHDVKLDFHTQWNGEFFEVPIFVAEGFILLTEELYKARKDVSSINFVERIFDTRLSDKDKKTLIDKLVGEYINDTNNVQQTNDTANTEPVSKVTLSDSELIDKCDDWVSSLAKTGGKSWCLRVPVDFKNDPDVLFAELINRFKATLKTK